MRHHKNRRRGAGCMRAFGLLILAVVFAGCAYLITSQKNAPVKPSVCDSEHRQVVHKHHASRPVEAPQPEEQPSAEKPSVTPAPVKPNISTHRAVVFPGEFARGDVSGPRIALTFDAGSGAAPASDILDTLAKHGIHATFFLTGKWVEKNPDLTRRIVAEGHSIGNHTFSHRRLTDLSSGEIIDEIERTEQLIMQLTGKSTKPLLRVPYGARDKRVLSVLEGLGYTSIYWDLDSWDSVKAGITSGEIEQRVLGRVRNGSVILMHCGSRPTADALDSILQKLEAAGYQPVTIGELMR